MEESATRQDQIYDLDEEVEIPKVKRIITGVIGIGVWVIFYYLFLRPRIIFPNIDDYSYVGKVFFGLGWYILCFGGPVLISFLLPLHFKPKDLKIRIPKIDPILTLKIISIAFAANFMISWVITILYERGGTVISDEDPFIPPQIAYLFLILILAPFFEEIFFRGMFITFGNRLFKKKYTYIISAVLFGFVHITTSFYVGVIAFIGALMYSFQRELDNSIIPCMISHFLWNLAVVIFPYYPTLDFL